MGLFQVLMSPVPTGVQRAAREVIFLRETEDVVTSVWSGADGGLDRLTSAPGRYKMLPDVIRAGRAYRADAVFALLRLAPRRDYLRAMDAVFSNPDFCIANGRFPAFRYRRDLCEIIVSHPCVDAVARYVDAFSFNHGAHARFCRTLAGW